MKQELKIVDVDSIEDLNLLYISEENEVKDYYYNPILSSAAKDKDYWTEIANILSIRNGTKNANVVCKIKAGCPDYNNISFPVDRWCGIEGSAPEEMKPYIIDGLRIISMSTHIFKGCLNLKSISCDAATTYDIKNGSYAEAFTNCVSLEKIDVTNWVPNTNDSSMQIMFLHCEKLRTIDWHTHVHPNLGSCFSTFKGCYELEYANVDIDNDGKMFWTGFMFASCYKLKEVILGSLINLTNYASTSRDSFDMQLMFIHCYDLQRVDLSKSKFPEDPSIIKLIMSNAVFADSGIRWVDLNEGWFKCNGLLGLRNDKLGMNEDESDNGWLAYIVSIAPLVTNTEINNIILFDKNLDKKSWSAPYFAALTNLGYTVSIL